MSVIAIEIEPYRGRYSPTAAMPRQIRGIIGALSWRSSIR